MDSTVAPELKGTKGDIIAARIEVPILVVMIYGIVEFIRLGWSQDYYLYTYAPVLGGVAASVVFYLFFSRVGGTSAPPKFYNHHRASISPMRPIAATAASRFSTRNPVTPSSISSRIDPRLQAMIGVPQASASTTDKPNGSSKLIRWSSTRAEPRVFARAVPPTGPR